MPTPHHPPENRPGQVPQPSAPPGAGANFDAENRSQDHPNHVGRPSQAEPPTGSGAGSKAIGIDLGTTNSAIAWVDDCGRTAMVFNAEGEILTPSVVLFDDAEVVVGKEARSAATIYPDRVAQWVKRDMGAAVYSRPIRGNHLPPEVIQACILRKLKTDLVQALGPQSRIVITVPAYFDELRRKATVDAGEMAGLTVLDIVNEPTAAALAFGEALGYLDCNAAVGASMNVLVYDLGGGTFDATLLRLSPGHVQTLATDGDVALGGYDWDLRLVDHVAQAFQQAHGCDPRQDPAALNHLLNAVVEAKHTLSARSSANVVINHAQRSLTVPITRALFEELTADLLERTAYTVRQLLTAAKMDWPQVTRILLVGGSTRMPMVSQMLTRMSQIVPDHRVNPDEAVARGAALYAHYLLCRQGRQPSPFQVVNVNSHSLGVEGIHAQTLRKTNVTLIPRNTPLPAQVKETFSTRSADQRSIVIQVLEGESSLPQECTPIGRAVIRDLPPGLAQGWPVEITFQYATNGRLTVRGVVSGTQSETVLAIERDVGVSDDGLVRWKQAVTSPQGFRSFAALAGPVSGREAPSSVPLANLGPAPAAPPAQPVAATAPAAGREGTRTWQPDRGVPDRKPRSTSHARTPFAPGATKRSVAHRWVNALAYLLSALVGLGLAYSVLAWKNPGVFPWPF